MEKSSVKNLESYIDGMNRFNSTPKFGTTRILFTKPELENRKYVKSEMEKLGLSVHEDNIGNIFATLEGSDPSLAPVWTGSHIDTVPNAGKFDGMAGVAAGLEAIRLIRESGEKHRRSIVTVVYTSEEPTRFGLSCLGSRAMSGDLDNVTAKNISDKSGRSLYDKLEELGYDADNLQAVRKERGDVFASVELHIEQNNKLELAGKPIGIVTKICAPSNYIVEVTGRQSHAGGTSMSDRRDAYMAACEMSLYLEELAKKCPSEYNTATIGCVKNIPDAVNVIPGKCTFSVDIRDCQKDTKDALCADFKNKFAEIARRRGVSVEITEENNDTPLTCSPAIREILKKSCKNRGYPYEELISGPYHDTLFVGKFAPAAMIFVPSRNGISHSPDEYTDYADIAKGCDVLAETLALLADCESL